MQIFREIRDMGMLRAVFLLAVIAPLLTLFIYRRLPVQGYEYAIPGMALLVVFIIHRNRKDYFFLSKMSNPPVWVFFVEYFVFSVPLLVLMSVFGLHIQALMYLVLLSAICLIKPLPKGTKTKYGAWVKHIPAAMFEWRSGIRVNLPAILFFYGLGIAGIYSIWLSVASIILLSLTFAAFYGANESQKILAASEQSADVFLQCKIGQHTKYWVLFLLPLLLVASAHYQYWTFILAAFAAALNLLIFAILAKYAYYRPASTGVLSQFVVSMAWLFSVILPLSILVFLTNIVLYFKAKNNLNYYLNACY